MIFYGCTRFLLPAFCVLVSASSPSEEPQPKPAVPIPSGQAQAKPFFGNMLKLMGMPAGVGDIADGMMNVVKGVERLADPKQNKGMDIGGVLGGIGNTVGGMLGGLGNMGGMLGGLGNMMGLGGGKPSPSSKPSQSGQGPLGALGSLGSIMNQVGKGKPVKPNIRSTTITAMMTVSSLQLQESQSLPQGNQVNPENLGPEHDMEAYNKTMQLVESIMNSTRSQFCQLFSGLFTAEASGMPCGEDIITTKMNTPNKITSKPTVKKTTTTKAATFVELTTAIIVDFTTAANANKELNI